MTIGNGDEGDFFAGEKFLDDELGAGGTDEKINLPINSTQVSMGGGVNDGALFDGTVFLVAVYDRALSVAEMDAHFTVGVGHAGDDSDYDFVPDNDDSCLFVANAAQVYAGAEPNACPRSNDAVLAAWRLLDGVDSPFAADVSDLYDQFLLDKRVNVLGIRTVPQVARRCRFQ